ncbi:MAG: signal peptidase I [Candidatus Moranbacteria bacterium]|nr:signal peptidase I [Candidatus Moranbacteria bacterium]
MENLNEKEEIYYGIGGFLVEMVKIFLLALIVIMPVRIFLFQPFFVQGASMEPNFEDGQYLIVNELGYKNTDLKIATVEPFKEIERGYVMIFRYPKNPKQFFIKRVIGLPGEKVELKNGKVYIYNDESLEGTELKEDYLPDDTYTQGSGKYEVGEDEYFVLGDNRSHSSDSRSWGLVSSKDIIGKVLLRAWPINKAGVF